LESFTGSLTVFKCTTSDHSYYPRVFPRWQLGGE